MKRRGFTLIELTVVLAAFLVLTAILFPIISEKREAERKRRNFHACQANIRQRGNQQKSFQGKTFHTSGQYGDLGQHRYTAQAD